MNLEQKSLAVLQVFAELESETKQFVSESGLGCISGCGFCCAKPKIPASPLEFLPLAFDLYEKGLAESTLESLDLHIGSENCIMYRPQSEDGKKGFCGNYSKRGMICRIFGASARKTKHGAKELIICKVIKEEKATAFEGVTQKINNGEMEIPIATSLYSRLGEIDESLCQEMDVNDAIAFALESVLRFKFYEQGELIP